MTVLDRDIARTPFVVVDIETTGLSPRHDRIVELALVAVRPGEEPQVVLDTLVRPEQRVSGTEIHGITQADVDDAPTFAEIAPLVMAACANRVVASHNAYFDVAFLQAEAERHGYPFDPPHVCTMFLPRVLDPAVPRLALRDACSRWKVTQVEAHAAVHDATAAAVLLREHLKACRKRKLETFAALRREGVGTYDFLQSFERGLVPPPPLLHAGGNLRPRAGRPANGRRANIAQYMEALLLAAADLRLDGNERAELQALAGRLALRADEVRAVHAKIFWGMLGRYVEDARVDAREADNLRMLRELLAALGWAPGDDVLRA